MFYKFETLRVQNFQKLIVSDLSEMKKEPSLVLSAVGMQAARATLVPSLQAQESGCSLRMFAKDLMERTSPPHWGDSRGILWMHLLLPLCVFGLGIQFASSSFLGFRLKDTL